jgi:FKBP-type peptidyl-prolyl cis-trans isomerase FkpA
MKKIGWILVAAIALSSCSSQDFKRGNKGLEYKVVKGGSSGTAKLGQFLEVQTHEYLSDGKTDTTLNDSRNSMPQIIPYDSTTFPVDYFKSIPALGKGDSLVIRVIVDSMLSMNPMGMPPFFKKGHYYYSTLKINNVYKNMDEANRAQQKNMMAQRARDSIDNIAILKKENDTLLNYFKKNNVDVSTLLKTKGGVYVNVTAPGSGPVLDTNFLPRVKYTGKLLNGKIFDTNMDSSKGHTDPLLVNVTSNPMIGVTVIPGWIEALKLLKLGSKATLYIPSPLAYGKQSPSPEIPPSSILVFDVDIVKVLTAQEAIRERDEKAKKKEADRMKREKEVQEQLKKDSLKNSKKVEK